MSELNHLFTGFSTLFDPEASAEEKDQMKASIQRNIENNLGLINRVAKEKEATKSTVTIYL